ncbi:MAG: hypothetical protein Greene041662_570, partial [Candidatus Peregrinibacteria bacterium Greene0416_62]
MTQPAVPEILEKKANSIVDALCIAQNTDGQRDALLKSIQDARTENPLIWDTISKKLASMDKKPLRDIANTNLGLLRDRIDANVGFADAEVAVQELRDELDLLQKNLSAPDPFVADAATEKGDPKKGQVPSRLPAAKEGVPYEEASEKPAATDSATKEVQAPARKSEQPAADSGSEKKDDVKDPKKVAPEVWYDPTSWPPERQQQAKDIAIVGGVVVGGAILLKLLFGRAKKAGEGVANAAHKVGEVTGSVLSGIKKVGVLSLAAVLGYFGIQMYRQVSKIKEQQEKYDEALARVKSAKDSELQAARRALEDAQQALTAAKEDKKISEPQQIIEKKVEEPLSIAMAIKALPLQYDVAEEIDPEIASPKPYLKDAGDILAVATQGSRKDTLRMSSFFDCMERAHENDGEYDKLLREIYGNDIDAWKPELRMEKIAALRFVLGFLKKNRDILERSARIRGENPGDLTLAEAMNVFAGMPSAVEGLTLRLASTAATSLMSLEIPDPIPAIQEFFAKDDLYSERMVELVLEPLLAEAKRNPSTPEERKKLRATCSAVAAHFLKNGNVQIGSINSSLPSEWTEDGSERFIARAIAERIRRPETVRRLLQSAMISNTSKNPDEKKKEEEIAQVLEEQLSNGKLSLRDAFQLFYLLESGGVSQALLFFKTAKILTAGGRHDLAADRYQAVASRLYEAVTEGPDAIAALMAELHLTPEQERELRNVALYMAEYASEAGHSYLDHLDAFQESHPGMATALGIGIGAPLLYTGYRVTLKPVFWAWTKVQWKLILNLADSDAVKIESIAGKYGKTVEQVSLAVHDAQLAVQRMRDVDIGIHAPFYKYRARRLGLQARQRAYGRARVSAEPIAFSSAGSVDDLARAVKELPNGWSKALEEIKTLQIGQNANPALVERIERAMIRCRELGLALEDAKMLMTDSRGLALLSDSAAALPPGALEQLLRTAALSGGKGVQRIAAYVFELGPNVTAELLDRTVIRAVAVSDAHPDAIARILRSAAGKKILNAGKSDQIVHLIETMSRWQRSGDLARRMFIGFGALDVAILGMDILSYEEMVERHRETIQGLEENLRQAGFQKVGDRWVHPGTKASLSFKKLEESILDLSDPQKMRIAADAASLPLAIPAIGFTPVGLGLLVVSAVVHTGIGAWEQGKNRDFLRHTPAAILTLLTTQATVGSGEVDMVADMSNFMISDLTRLGSEREKSVLRRKLIAILFARELLSVGEKSPDVVAQVTQGKDLGTFLNERGEFLGKEFDAVIVPYVAARLFQRSNDGGVQWQNFRTLKIHEGWLDLDNVSDSDVRLVLRDAVHLFAQHVMERSYRRERQALQEREALRKRTFVGPMQEVSQIQTRARMEAEDAASSDTTKALGETTVFGARIDNLDISVSTTAVERAIHAYTDRLDALSLGVDGKPRTRDAMKKEQPDLFTATLPAGSRSNDQQNARVLNIADLARESLQRKETAPETSAPEVLAKATAVYEYLREVGYASSGPLYASHEHYIQLSDYANYLAQHPSFDAKGWLRTKISNLGKEWDWSKITLSQEFGRKRNTAFSVVMEALAI